jgi:hypothetical protein
VENPDAFNRELTGKSEPPESLRHGRDHATQLWGKWMARILDRRPVQ